MFDLILQWSKRMAEKIKATAQGRPRELPRVRLIPVVDPASGAILRKKEVQVMLIAMFANLHKRGRPRKGDEEETDHAA